MQMRFNIEMKFLGERIKHYREKLGLTQGAIGKAVGLDQPTISKLERGEMHETTKIAQLAKILEVDCYWLATGEGSAVVARTTEGALAAQVIDGIKSDYDRQHALKIVNTFSQPAEGTNDTK